MRQEHLTRLALLNIHRDVIVDPLQIVNRLAQRGQRLYYFISIIP